MRANEYGPGGNPDGFASSEPRCSGSMMPLDKDHCCSICGDPFQGPKVHSVINHNRRNPWQENQDDIAARARRRK